MITEGMPGDDQEIQNILNNFTVPWSRLASYQRKDNKKTHIN